MILVILLVELITIFVLIRHVIGLHKLQNDTDYYINFLYWVIDKIIEEFNITEEERQKLFNKIKKEFEEEE